MVNLGGHVDHTDKTKTLKSHFYGSKNLAQFFLKKKINVFIQMGSRVSMVRLNHLTKKKFGNPKSTYGLSNSKHQIL